LKHISHENEKLTYYDFLISVKKTIKNIFSMYLSVRIKRSFNSNA